MTTPNNTSPENNSRFAGIDYSRRAQSARQRNREASLGPNTEREATGPAPGAGTVIDMDADGSVGSVREAARGTTGVTRGAGGVMRTPAAPTPAARGGGGTSRAAQAGAAMDKARAVVPERSRSGLVATAAAAAEMAARAPDARVAAAGRIAGVAINTGALVGDANQALKDNGIDVGASAKRVLDQATERIRQRPPREQGLFAKVAGAFGRGGEEQAVPEPEENVGGYTARMVGTELEQRRQAGVPATRTEGLEEFVESSRELDRQIILDAEIVEDTPVTDPPAPGGPAGPGTQGPATGGAGGGSGAYQQRARRLDRPGTEITRRVTDLERQWDDLDERHRFTSEGTGRYVEGEGYWHDSDPVAEKQARAAAREAVRDEAAAPGLPRGESTHPETLEFEPVGVNAGDHYHQHDITRDKINAFRNSPQGQAHTGGSLPYDQVKSLVESLEGEAGKTLARTNAEDSPTSKENLDKTPAQSVAAMRGNHDRYAAMMAMACVTPLSQGIDADSLVAAASMGAVMWAMSPAFREYVGASSDGLAKALDGRMSRESAKAKQGGLFKNAAQRLRMNQRADARTEEVNGERERMTGGDGKHAKMTKDSAAMMLVDLGNNTYRDLREPGANQEAIVEKYSGTQNLLYQEFEKDGLSRDEVDERARWIVGNQAQRSDKASSAFLEANSGEYMPSQSTGADGTWDSQWRQAADPRQVIAKNAGFFHLRLKQDDVMHAGVLQNAMTRDLAGSLQKLGGPSDEAGFAELKDKLVGYIAGGKTAGVMDMSGRADPTALAAKRVHMRINAMSDDGIDPGVQAQVLDGSIYQTIDHLSEHYPKEMARLEDLHPEWVQEAAAFRDAPQEYLDARGGQTVTAVRHPSLPLSEEDLPAEWRQQKQAMAEEEARREVAREARDAATPAGQVPGQGHSAAGEENQARQRARRQARQQAQAQSAQAGTGTGQGAPGEQGRWDSGVPPKNFSRSSRPVVGETGVSRPASEYSAAAPARHSTHGADDGVRGNRDTDGAPQRERVRDAGERQAAAEYPGTGDTTREPVNSDGVGPMTSAQRREAEAYNRDYSTAPDERVSVNYDDPSTPEQEGAGEAASSSSRSKARRQRIVAAQQSMATQAENEKAVRRLQREAARQNLGTQGPGLNGPDFQG